MMERKRGGKRERRGRERGCPDREERTKREQEQESDHMSDRPFKGQDNHAFQMWPPGQ